jgi:hypothetical protein
MTQSSLKLQPLNKQALEAYQRLLPHQSDMIGAGKLGWKFNDNPVSKGVIATYEDEQESIMALNGFMPVRLRLSAGRTSDGFQSMDTIVDPSLRGKGIFTKLHQTFYDANQSGFVYGFPNSSSAPNFFGRLKWQRVSSAPLLFKPLRASFFLRRLGVKYNVRRPSAVVNLPPVLTEVRQFSKTATDIWSSFFERNGIEIAVDRNADYLNWRLFGHPAAKYQVLSMQDQAFCATTVEDKHGYRIGYVMESFGDDALLPKLVKAVTAKLKREGAEVALAMCFPGSTAYKALRRAGFLPLPDRFRPIQINFGIRSFGSENFENYSSKNWYVSYLDSDTV